MVYVVMLLCFVCSIIFTPLVKKFAIKIGAVARINDRTVHKGLMPQLGGLAIFISFLIGFFLLKERIELAWTLATPMKHIYPLIIASFIIIITGLFDDMLELSAKLKLLGQLLAATVVVVWGGVQVEFINLPFGGHIQFGIFSIPLTIIWILAITNAINLIDGLDGLAAGVSSIALVTMCGMALIMGNVFVALICAILLASTLGFLVFNFHPAKIFMGDTGALFLGFMIGVLSLLGFKNVTFIALLIPVIILGVPLSDTFFAIIRRFINKKPIYAPDKSHLHHCLLRLGYSHKQTVLIIYAIAALFGLSAIIFSMSTIWGSITILVVLLLSLEIFVESISLISENYKPLLRLVKVKRSPEEE